MLKRLVLEFRVFRFIVRSMAMASVGSVTRQIAALEISAKQNGATKPTRPLQKTTSQTSVSKLLTKFAAPNPFPDSKLKPSAKPKPGSTTKQPASVKPAAQKPLTEAELDIGKYDGGFEIENEKRGEAVQGEAARELALDSSVSRYCGYNLPCFIVVQLYSPERGPHGNGISPTLISVAR